MTERTPSRDNTTPISAGNQFGGGFLVQTTDTASRPSPRQRARSNSTPDKRLAIPGYTVIANVDHRRNQDRNTWSAGSASPIVQRSPPTLQRSPSTTGRNQSQTNLPLHRSPSNSPITPVNIQPTPSNSSTYIPSTLSRRFSKSSQLSPAPARPRPILFYHKHEPHYGFTNFSNHAVKYEGRVYPTSEHLFQSLKFAHRPLLAEHIRTCDTRPSVAFSEARRFQPEVRHNWKDHNIKAMDTTIWHKFTQHRELGEELLATGDAELIENSDKDAFWGCGADGKGKNELGKALVRLRTKLRG
ncbi:DUF1768-domain-containing protein [Thelephora ganbajun]|uniref:DUF1768-domain-containing protein n=1 Tax=Thelephora ganbajun TaxID=370292 RepID=A0ACB6ZGY2_THEGA|nr:DUF1768-domain-containing protein [Thelephora ganbajun]